ncbi:MAG: STAS domain-containing protein [Candidatus Aquicultor sp.]
MAEERRLRIEITEQKSITTVLFSGTYDEEDIVLMKEMLNALIRNNRLKLILEFGSLETLNENALDYLGEVHSRVAKLGGSVVLACPSESQQAVCERLKRTYGFLVFSSFDEAREYFIGREF